MFDKLFGKYGKIWEEYRGVKILALMFAILAGIFFIIAAFLACPSENPIACLVVILICLFFTACLGVLVWKAERIRGKLDQAFGE